MNLNDKIRLISDGEFEVIAKLSVDEITAICRELRGKRHLVDWMEQEIEMFNKLQRKSNGG